MNRMKQWIHRGWLLLLVLGMLVTALPVAAQDAPPPADPPAGEITPAATLEDPTIFARDVSGFVVKSPVLYWFTLPPCPGPDPKVAPAATPPPAIR